MRLPPIDLYCRGSWLIVEQRQLPEVPLPLVLEDLLHVAPLDVDKGVVDPLLHNVEKVSVVPLAAFNSGVKVLHKIPATST